MRYGLANRDCDSRIHGGLVFVPMLCTFAVEHAPGSPVGLLNTAHSFTPSSSDGTEGRFELDRRCGPLVIAVGVRRIAGVHRLAQLIGRRLQSRFWVAAAAVLLSHTNGRVTVVEVG